MSRVLSIFLLSLLPIFSYAEGGLDEKINEWFEPITAVWESIVFCGSRRQVSCEIEPKII